MGDILTLKVGFIGAGSIARHHISAAQAVGFVPTAICAKNFSERANKLSSEFEGLAYYPNLDSILEAEIDCLCILLNTDISLEIYKKVITKRNIPVLIEKPVTQSSVTLTDNLESIIDEGLIPKRYPNSFYEEGTEGIFLTTSPSLYNANLPQSLMDVMDEYYEDEESYDKKPIVRLTVDITKLDNDLFDVDDDYKMNLYGWNKSENDEDKIIESLDLWRSITYNGIISSELIKNIDFNYGA
jgi:hypothetical protein